jgi:hypothetical protein
MCWVLNKKTGVYRHGCDAEIGTYGNWKSCKRPVMYKRTVTITAGIHRGPSTLYFCKGHLKHAYEPLLKCMSGLRIENLQTAETLV